MENEAQALEPVKMDLPFDVHVNGVAISAGKSVDVPGELADAVSEIVAERKAALKVQRTHQGAVKE